MSTGRMSTGRMKTVILAGGRGVRLRPLTYTIPKPLLPIGEKPILEEIIDRLKASGFDDLVIAVGYRAELIETYFRDGAHLGVHIEYVRETQPLGTAGPLALVRDAVALADGEPLLVMNGDILTDLDMRALTAAHRQSGHEVTVVTRDHVLQHPYGVIQVQDGRVTGIVEKPSVTDTVSAGIYAVQPSALDLIPKDEFVDIPDLINRLLAGGRPVGAYRFDGEWLAIDRIEQLEDAARLLAERHA
ncbi:MAG: NTP transferase domain-containing protein [Chloroflexi bacterium]|nr:NTP transferase domain-containing protein [Chloroflexota bacterium]